MAREFRVVERDQVMLLPPDLRDWLPPDHLAWLVLDVVDQLDLSVIESTFRRGGTGREAFDPGLLTALLVYGYCQGVRSSRQIERACVTDVAFRVVAAQQRPDHTTIARFRARHAAALADLFGQVLTLCQQAGLGQVGVVAVDGTKIAGQASPRKNYTEKTLRRLAEDILDDAAATDAAEDATEGPDRRGDELPDTLRPGADRAARIRQALRRVEEQKAQARAGDVAAGEQRLARARRTAQRHRDDIVRRPRMTGQRRPRLAAEDQARVKRADARVAVLTEELAQARAGNGRRAQTAAPTANVSDPDTQIMFVRGKGYLQGYNAQVAVSDDYLIVATEVTAETSDLRCFVPMMQLAVANVAAHLPSRQIETVLADAGYCTIDALTADGPDRLIATGRKPDRPAQTGKTPPIAAMAQRLAEGSRDRVTYQRRQATVEPVIGQLKDRIGLRRFARRGLQAAKHELALAATAHNIHRLATA